MLLKEWSAGLGDRENLKKHSKHFDKLGFNPKGMEKFEKEAVIQWAGISETHLVLKYQQQWIGLKYCLLCIFASKQTKYSHHFYNVGIISHVMSLSLTLVISHIQNWKQNYPYTCGILCWNFLFLWGTIISCSLALIGEKNASNSNGCGVQNNCVIKQEMQISFVAVESNGCFEFGN